MPVGYAVPGFLLAVASLIVLVPPRTRHAGLSFWIGAVLNELPHLAFYLLLASTVLTVAGGDVRSAAGWVSVGVGVLAMVVLALLFARGLRARSAVDRSLRRAGLGGRPRRRWPWTRIMLAPFYRRRGDVEHLRNLSFGPGGRRQQLDVYRHRSHPAGAPMLIHFHGGGYGSGHKNSQSLPLIYRLASRGWVCISANYRLRPAFGFRDHLDDAKRVIAWAHENGAGYGGDPDTLVVAGSSAGAHLTALCAFTQNDPRFQPYGNADTSLTAAVCLNGYLGDYNDAQDIPSSPWDYMRPDAPPFLVVHGDIDPLVPVADARAFAERLREVSTGAVHYLELPGGQHAFDLFHSPRFEAVIDGVEAFTTAVRRGDVAARRRGAPA
jgi:acetyl esterase/lipase